MRLACVVLLTAFVAGAWAQLTAGEARTLDDAMTLANLRPDDLRSVTPPAGARAAHVAALRDPLAGLNEAAARHEGATGDEAKMLRTAYAMLGGAMPRGASGRVAELPASVPAPLRRPVGILVAAIAAADDEIRAATSRLGPAERRTLIEALPRLAADDAALPLDYAKAPSPDFAAARRLLDLVDVGRIEAAGITLAEAVQDAIPALQAVPNKRIPKSLFRAQGVLVELAGDGPDLHDRRDVALCIDLGGDDRYTGRYGAGVGYAGVLIDLGGNDRYSGPDVNLGTGLLGIGILEDLGGDDVYGVRSAGLGCGLAGLGMLVDAGGDDRYRVVGLGLGAGARGIGLLSDRLGDDAYEAGSDGEGFGTLEGLGWSVDGDGNDTYRGGEAVQATGRDLGFGLLTDLAGDDLYRATSGQAWAPGGYASLGDLRGNDTYLADRGQGFASEGGAAFLVEGAGDDSYLLRKGPGQAAAFGGVAVLLDRAGDDVYGGTDGTPATALGGGVAILLEAEGDDRYLASAPFRPSEDGASLWADGNGRDRYGDGRADAQARAGLSAAAYDAYGAREPVPPPIFPTPGSSPVPAASALLNLRRRATEGPDRVGALASLVGIGVPALETLAADPDGESTFLAVAARMGAAAEPAVGRLVVSDDPRLVRLGLGTAEFVAIPSAAIVAALGKPETAAAAVEAAGSAGTVAAVPALSRLALAGDPRAVAALAAIGEPDSAATGAALVDHADPAVRRAAFRLVLRRPEVAESTGRRLADAPDAFRQRIGLALLGAAHTPTSLIAVEPYLKGTRDQKIGALLALDGQIPVAMIPTVEALRRDVDPLVRAVAERIDVG